MNAFLLKMAIVTDAGNILVLLLREVNIIRVKSKKLFFGIDIQKSHLNAIQN